MTDSAVPAVAAPGPGAPAPSPRSLLDPDLAAAYAAFLMHYFLPVSWVRAFICPEIADAMADLEAAGGAR